MNYVVVPLSRIGHPFPFVAVVAIATWSSTLADVGMESTDDGWQWILFSETRLAAVYWATAEGELVDCNESFAQMFGYASRTNRFENVDQDLFAKALALQDQKGYRAVIVTMDLGGLPTNVAESVCLRGG